jgi:hypothetical protein
MGLDFNIITETGEIIDRYSINWLYYYDGNSFLNTFNFNKNILNVILYCNEQIAILEKKTNGFEQVEKINNLEFNEKKENLAKLITNTNNNEEINDIIKKIYMVIFKETEDLNHYKKLLGWFKSFKLFLEKYQGYKYSISC